MYVNQILGNYKLLKLIGKGGQGKIYKALDLSLKRIVGIKVFFAQDDSRRLKLANFKYEARLASAIDHPNICKVYALFEDEKHTYMVMEYIDGKNLAELAYHRPLAVKSVLNIIIQVTDALVAAHAQGIIHRDIKPRNVMVTESGRAVLLDFGLAKLIENGDGSFSFDPGEIIQNEEADEGFIEDIAEDLFVTVEGMPYGTPASSAPEMALGKQTDQRTDIYSIGILLYLLLTGTYPFLAKTIDAVREKVLNEEPLPISKARKAGDPSPLKLNEIVERTLQKNPENRFQSMAALHNELLAIQKEMEDISDTNISAPQSVLTNSSKLQFAPLPAGRNWLKTCVVSISITVILLSLILVYIFYI